MLQVYSLLDKKTGAYGKPMFASHVQEVIRSFITELENPQSFLARFSADYSLWRVGHFEQDTGALMAPQHGGPEHVAELAALFTQIPPKGDQK